MNGALKQSVLGALALLLVPTAAIAKPKWERVPLETQWLSAVHESAHLVVGLAANPTYEFEEVWVATKTNDTEDDFGKTAYYYRVGFAKTPQGATAMAAGSFAGAMAEELLMGLRPKGISGDLNRIVERCQNHPNTGACYLSAEALARNLVVKHARVIKIVAEMIMAQPPDPKDYRMRLRGKAIETMIRALIFLSERSP